MQLIHLRCTVGDTLDKKIVYSILRERILVGDYRPGEILKEKQLVQEFKIGRTPLRELLIRLSAERLVQIVPHSGVYVSSVEFEELVDVMEVRRPLIKMAGELAAARATKDEVKRMKEFLGKFKNNLTEKELTKLDSQFHDLVNMATHNKALYEILETLRNQVMRLWMLPKESSFIYHSKEYFQRLISAIEKKDKKSAADVLTSHIESFIEEIKKQL